MKIQISTLLRPSNLPIIVLLTNDVYITLIYYKHGKFTDYDPNHVPFNRSYYWDTFGIYHSELKHTKKTYNIVKQVGPGEVIPL